MKKYFLFCFCIVTYVSANAYGNEKDSLLQQIDQFPSDDVRHLHAKTMLANDFLLYNLDTTGILLRESNALADMHDHPVERADWLNISAAYNWYRGNRDSAMVNYRNLYQLDHPDIVNRRASAAVNLASLFRMRMEEDSTLYYFSMARILFAEAGDSAGIAHTDYSLASNYYRQNNYHIALDYALRAYEYRHSRLDTFDLIYVHNLLGSIYNNLKDNERTLHHYEKSLYLIGYHPNHPVRSSVYNNLSSFMAWRIGDFEEALRYSQSAIDLARKNENLGNLYVYYNNHGKILSSMGNYQQALDYHQKAKEYYPEDIIDEIAAGVLTSRGDAYMGLGNHIEARRLFQEAIQLATKGKASVRKKEAYHSLFKLDSIEGNYLQALEHLQKVHSIHNEIWEEERTNRISELKIIHETSRIEAENKMLIESNLLKEAVIENQRRFLLASTVAIFLIVLLLFTILWSRRNLKKKNDQLEAMHQQLIENQLRITEQNQELDKQKHDLEELNRTKDKFFSIVAHDLRGPFTALMGYLNILQEDFHTMSEDEKKEMLHSLNKTSNNAYNFTVNLLEWANLQRNRIQVVPRTFSLDRQVEVVISSLDFSIRKKNLDVINKVPSMEIRTDINIINSILTNLINNAVKFTPQGGRIVIEAKKAGNEFIEVCVADNGIGIEPDKQAALFDLGSNYRQEGTDGEPGTGIGLLTTKEFVSLLDGRIEVTSEKNKGSRFCFTFRDQSGDYTD